MKKVKDSFPLFYILFAFFFPSPSSFLPFLLSPPPSNPGFIFVKVFPLQGEVTARIYIYPLNYCIYINDKA